MNELIEKIYNILNLVLLYQENSNDRIMLTASENIMSIEARVPLLTDIIHRYSFPIDDKDNWAWPGRRELAEIEWLVKDEIRSLLDVEYVNVKPISGLNCMLIALSALGENNPTLFSISTKNGGHGATTFIAERLGMTVVYLPFDPVTFSIDFSMTERIIGKYPGKKLVYLDQSNILFPFNLQRLRKIFGDDVIIHYDGSHVMGLISGGCFQKPLIEGVDVFGGSTHKSFPGPQKAFLVTNSPQLAEKIDIHASFLVSHHEPANIVSLAIAMYEMKQFGSQYATQTIRNAKALGKSLHERGFYICASDKGYTESHQVWVDIKDHLEDPLEAARLCFLANIIVNAIEIPCVRGGVGLRLGVAELTRMGMNENDMDLIADLFEKIIIRKIDPKSLRPQVKDLKQSHIDLKYKFPIDKGIIKRIIESGFFY